MKNKNQSFTAEFKAGTYFIGDPCYALRDDLYDKWINEHKCNIGNYHYFAVGNTANGDGTYEDINSGEKYDVDAGILGVVNMKFANADANKNDILNKLGKIITVENHLIFAYNYENSLFCYKCDDKHIIIPTEIELEEYEIENEY